MRANFSVNPTEARLPPRQRLYTVDLLRWLSFYAITVFHITFALWARYGFTAIPFRGAWVWPLENFARALAFSGFTVLLLSFFMMGNNPRERASHSPKRAFLPILLILFTLAWSATVEEFPYIWDIYPFLLCAFALLAICQRLKFQPRALTAFGALLLSIPFWRLESFLNLPTWLNAILFGACDTRKDLGDWPLLPWLGLPLFAYGVGALCFQYRGKLARLSRGETLVWSLLLIATVPRLGAYFHTPLGEEFGCFAFRRTPVEFYAHQIWVLFAVRLSLLPGFNRWCARQRIPQFITRSAVNQRFFLVYFLHYPAVFALAFFGRQKGWDNQAWILPLIWSVIFVFIEGLPVVIRVFIAHNGRYGQGSAQSHKLPQNVGA